MANTFAVRYKCETGFYSRLGTVKGLDNAPNKYQKALQTVYQDELPMISKNKLKLLAHPEGGVPCPANISQPMSLAFGPEGGFTKFEVSQFINEDFKQIQLGERILNIETAIPFTIGKLSRF